MNLSTFIRQAWDVLGLKTEYRHNWHIDAIASKLESVSNGEIKRLQIWSPPRTMKSLIVSVIWPAWEWTHSPELKYLGASYDMKLASDFSCRSRNLMLSDWYQDNWGNVFEFRKMWEASFLNNKGGTRQSVSPCSNSTGMTAHRIVIDDPIAPGPRLYLQETNDWYDHGIVHRGILGGARVIVMSRMGEGDLASHALQQEEWDVLCLPERYEQDHPFAWSGDPRKEGELLWPQLRTEDESKHLSSLLGTERTGNQLQQGI